MIKRFLQTLFNGLIVLKKDTRLLFIGVLVFFFPVMFLFISQSFFDAAFNNINTAQKQRIGILHDSIALSIESDQISQSQDFFSSQATTNPDIVEIRILERTDEGLLIRSSYDTALIDTIEIESPLYDSVPRNDSQSFIFEYIVDDSRSWRVVRNLSIEDGTQYYIVSLHSFAQLDSVMLSRRLNSYLGLSVIFVFLIGLAYWVSSQTDWQLRHNKVVQQLSDRDLFTSMIAHEFRSPLTVINGYISFLTESKELSAEDSRHVQIIKTSTAKLLALVNDFLEVARIQSGKLNVEQQSIDVRTILAEIVDSLTPMAREKNLQLTSDLPSVPLFVQTDSKRLTQIVHNIVTNAIKYTPKGSVTISLVDSPRNYTITIKDTGMGISATDQQKLFAPFSRVGGVEDTTITGTGLGMWITKQLVELLHGTVTIESIKGVGTHVVIEFRH